MPTLQEMLGDSYKEGMTVEEISSFFEGKKFADLSTGNYVDKNKYTNEVNSLTAQLNQARQDLNDKLSDDEKAQKASQAQADRIKQLEKLLSDNTISGNKNTVNSIMTSSRDILGIKNDDADFKTFVDNITTEDTDKSTAIASYFAKVINDSYEKGKQDALKDEMGNFGKGKGKQGGDDGDEIGAIGKRLADAHKGNENTYDYFNKQ